MGDLEPSTRDSRRGARERALELLYEAEAKGVPAGDVLAGLPVKPDDLAVELVQGVDARRAEIDASYAAYDEHPLDEPDEWGSLAAWLDAAMAHAVMYDTDHAQTVASLEIKVSFLERVGPGPGRVVARVNRRGARVAFLEADLYSVDGRLAAQATSTGMIIAYGGKR